MAFRAGDLSAGPEKKKSFDNLMDDNKTSNKVIVFTLGHSNRPIADFIAILRARGVACIADVRSAPGSRYNPQFNQGELAASLAGAGIKYIHMPGRCMAI
jgi:hypothetical protein